MAINLKQHENLWIIEINEKLAYTDFKKMETDLGMLLDFKKNNGNLQQQLQETKKNKIEKEIAETKKQFKKILNPILEE